MRAEGQGTAMQASGARKIAQCFIGLTRPDPALLDRIGGYGAGPRRLFGRWARSDGRRRHLGERFTDQGFSLFRTLTNRRSMGNCAGK
jgi:hypothetical protein